MSWEERVRIPSLYLVFFFFFVFFFDFIFLLIHLFIDIFITISKPFRLINIALMTANNAYYPIELMHSVVSPHIGQVFDNVLFDGHFVYMLKLFFNHA